MATPYHGAPLHIDSDGTAVPLSRLLIGDAAVGADYDEDAIRNLAFDHPACLPIGEIDSSYLDPIAVCKELSTPAGPIDALLVTRSGRLIIVEAKLWKNPEARRKVIGQILDYAKELKRWGYEDLQREVARSTGKKGNALYELVKRSGGDLDEASFVDAVSRSLSRGQFLLLVIGDGIKEGAAKIAEFLQETGTLEYTLGMVEMTLYRGGVGDLFVQPRVIAKTEIIERSVFEIRDERIKVDVEPEDEETRIDLNEKQKWYQDFWTELLGRLTLDDPSQPMANPTRTGNIFFPIEKQQVWISAFFGQSRGLVGVYINFAKGESSDRIYSQLLEDREEIDRELGRDIKWKEFEPAEKHFVSTIRTFGKNETKNPANREEIIEFLLEAINRFVNAFRHRVNRLAGD
ncbi:MAG TPA: DUF4268 domain-containing protein [Verrucomicrobiales bacterium]|nr:DUF4268 domain-containing protein [Verrucomicrobiales bacterium]